MENFSDKLKKTVALLKENHFTIATAESCTGGMLSAYLTSVPGASAVFELGISSYSGRIKHKVLGVRDETLKQYGAVSRKTAAEMASHVRRVGDAQIGVSITGVAGPDASEGKAPGTVYIASADARSVTAEKLTIEPIDRETVRRAACEAVIELVLKYFERRKADA